VRWVILGTNSSKITQVSSEGLNKFLGGIIFVIELFEASNEIEERNHHQCFLNNFYQ
jgi:hypothetical protein